MQALTKYQPNSEISKRVWQLLRTMLHTSLRKLAQMIKVILISNALWSVEEINLVMSHQNCSECMLAKINRRVTVLGFGLR